MTAATVSGPSRRIARSTSRAHSSEQPPSRVQRPQRPGDGWVTWTNPGTSGANGSRDSGMPVADIAP